MCVLQVSHESKIWIFSQHSILPTIVSPESSFWLRFQNNTMMFTTSSQSNHILTIFLIRQRSFWLLVHKSNHHSDGAFKQKRGRLVDPIWPDITSVDAASCIRFQIALSQRYIAVRPRGRTPPPPPKKKKKKKKISIFRPCRDLLGTVKINPEPSDPKSDAISVSPQGLEN